VPWPPRFGAPDYNTATEGENKAQTLNVRVKSRFRVASRSTTVIDNRNMTMVMRPEKLSFCFRTGLSSEITNKLSLNC
jgi:hypothetical protein